MHFVQQKTNEEGCISVDLSTQEQAQITEIFELFDTDGTGTVDSHELDAAMYALGFQPALARPDSRRSSSGSLSPVSVHGSKSVTLEEFTRLMKGEIAVSYTHLTLPTKRIV